MKQKPPTPDSIGSRGPSLRNRGLAIGVGLMSALTSTAPALAAYHPPEAYPDEPGLANLHPEHLRVTTPESKLLARHTVRVGNFCSGDINEDKNGNPASITLATHCIEDRPGWTLTPLTDKLTLRTSPKPISIKRGDHETDLEVVAKVTQFITSNEGANNDVAVAVLPSKTPEQTIGTYKPLKPEEISQYRKGSKIIVSGWPGKQRAVTYVNRPNSQSVEIKYGKSRQQYAMRYVGMRDMASPRSGAIIKTAVALGFNNENDAGCTPGDSGGVGKFAHINKKINSRTATIGPLTMYFDMDEPMPGVNATDENRRFMRSWVQQEFGVSTKGMRYICYFALDNPGEDSTLTDLPTNPPLQPIRPIPSTPPGGNPNPGEIGDAPLPIPEKSPIELMIEKATADFNNPEIEKFSPEGYVRVSLSETKSAWLKNPLVFYNSDARSALLGYRDAEGNLKFLFMQSGLDKLKLYVEEDRNKVELHTIKGIISDAEAGADDPAPRYLATDSLGHPYEFGEMLSEPPAVDESQTAHLEYVNGLVVMPDKQNTPPVL